MTETGKAEGMEEAVAAVEVHHHGTPGVHTDAEGITDEGRVGRYRGAFQLYRLREVPVGRKGFARSGNTARGNRHQGGDTARPTHGLRQEGTHRAFVRLVRSRNGHGGLQDFCLYVFHIYSFIGFMPTKIRN